MIVTRHISLDKDCIDKIEPYVRRHNGNFSAAVREIIERENKRKLASDEASEEEASADTGEQE